MLNSSSLVKLTLKITKFKARLSHFPPKTRTCMTQVACKEVLNED